MLKKRFMTTIIACEVMKNEIEKIKPGHEIKFHFVSMGLHSRPEKLHNELDKLISEEKNSSRIILGFGLCGGSLKNLGSNNAVLTIPKVHDCIPVLLGSMASYKAYQKEKQTYYLSAGWLESEKNILSEFKRVNAQYGADKAKKVFKTMYNGYEKILYINSQCKKNGYYKNKSVEAAGLLNLEHEEINGDLAYIEKLVNGPWDKDFINILPGEKIREENFYRQVKNFY
jgi:Protein of unknown function (DUF1638)